VADPVALTTARIAQTLAALMEKPLQIIGAPHAMNAIGHKPWSVDNPVRLSLSAALATGWQGPPAYADALPPYLDYLLAHVDDWKTAFPVFAGYGHDPFDYAGENAAFSRAD
jgi:hypothetical protein